MTVLLIEDQADLALIISDSLHNRGFSVKHCINGDDALKYYITHQPAIIILDIMLPGTDGFTIAENVRKLNSIIPILFLTAKRNVEDVIKGFEKGGNDYLKKPFDMDELIIRMKSLLKKTHELETNRYLKIGEYTLDTIQNKLKRADKITSLSFRETELLTKLIVNRNQILKRQEILLKFWENDSFFSGRSLDVFICRFRKYLQHDPRIKILNIRGVGYKLFLLDN